MIYCNKCGKENIDSFKFCTSCGNSFSNRIDIPSQTQTQYPIQKRHKSQVVILGLVGLFGIFAGGIGGYYLSNKNSSDSNGNELIMVQDTLEKANSPNTKLEVNTPVIISTTDQASAKPLSSLQENNQSSTYKKDDELGDKSLRFNENVGASVMLDKMNVFYIGVPNPITISSWSDWDKTSVSIIGGTITGTGSNRVVTVNEVGAASIIIAAEGKSAKYNFRVKRVPDPIIKIGPADGGKIQTVVFRNQQFIRAEMVNFDFDAKFIVNGATVYFTNPGDRNVKQVSLSSGELAPAKAYMDQLVPGAAVIFDNIRVIGPDGQPRTIQNPPGFSLF